jgi:predicted transcriptional regulator
MNTYEESEFERRSNNLQSLSRLAEMLCNTLELSKDPADMAIDMEKALEQSFKNHGIIKNDKE